MTAPRKVTQHEVAHVVGLVSGVTAKDNIFEAAEKAISTMRSAFGSNDRAALKAERMLAAAKARHAAKS